MEDMTARLVKLRDDAEDCALISRLANDRKKRELFARLADHLSGLADEVERAIAEASVAEARRPSFGRQPRLSSRGTGAARPGTRVESRGWSVSKETPRRGGWRAPGLCA